MSILLKHGSVRRIIPAELNGYNAVFFKGNIAIDTSNPVQRELVHNGKVHKIFIGENTVYIPAESNLQKSLPEVCEFAEIKTAYFNDRLAENEDNAIEDLLRERIINLYSGNIRDNIIGRPKIRSRILLPYNGKKVECLFGKKKNVYIRLRDMSESDVKSLINENYLNCTIHIVNFSISANNLAPIQQKKQKKKKGFKQQNKRKGFTPSTSITSGVNRPGSRNSVRLWH